MLQKYTTDQFWKLYKGLPSELQKVISSDETADTIYDICKRYYLNYDIYKIAESVSQVLLGLLSPTDLQKTLEKELELEKEIAKQVTREINRFILYPVKSRLEELYKIEIVAPAGMKITPPPQERPPTPPEEKDTYREDVG